MRIIDSQVHVWPADRPDRPLLRDGQGRENSPYRYEQLLADMDRAGTMFCVPGDDALYISRLAVAPAWRRRGVASALVEAARAEARHRGIVRLTLGARIALPGNVALFRRHGFAVVAETCHAGFTSPTSYELELRLG